MPIDVHEAARWGVAAFVSNPNADDTTLRGLLVEAGVPFRLAMRVLVFLPLAFARVLLATNGPRFSDECAYLDASGEVVARGELSKEPVFAAALELARHASRDEMQTIALRSGEINALNQALHAGSQMENLVFAPPSLYLDVPAGEETSEPHRLHAGGALLRLLHSHGLRGRRDGNALVLPGGQRFEACVYPRELTRERTRLQLDLHVHAPALGDRLIVESFAGVGATVEAALTSAFDRLARGSLHVIFAALVDESLGGDQIEWETWGEGDAAWRVCLGPVLALYSPSQGKGIADWLASLRTLFTRGDLAREAHWVRAFHASRGGQTLGSEVLLDNRPWGDGERLWRDRSWPAVAPDALVGARHFCIVLPQSSPARAD